MGYRVRLVAATVLATSLAALAAETKPPRPTTHVVRREPFKIEVALKGVFEAERMFPVVFRPKAWNQLVVEKAVEHGAVVKKGQVVLALRTEKLDEAIAETEAQLATLEPSIRIAEAELAAMEKTLDMDLKAAERARKFAEEDSARYFASDRPLAIKNAQFAVKTRENYLQYQKEELRQLEKMYEADDLTEETEEIVLKRQRDAVERAEFALEVERANAKRVLEVEIPRKDIEFRENPIRQQLAAAKAKTTIPENLRKKRLEVQNLERSRQKTRDKLAKLKADRQGLVVTAPFDGVVYYGPCTRGKWPKLSSQLPPGTSLQPNVVVLTVVAPRPLFVRATVPEKELHRLALGQSATVIPVAFPEQQVKATLKSLSAVPVAEGSFDATFSLVLPKKSRLMPGMNCTVKVLCYRKDKALTVPNEALHTDEAGRTFVWVRGKDGKASKRMVRVGKKGYRKTEILEGLAEGETVFLKKP